MDSNPRNSDTQRLLRALRENIRLKLIAGQAAAEVRLAGQGIEEARNTIGLLCELLAFLRLGVTHENSEGAGLIAASLVSGNGRLWRHLPEDVKSRIEQRQATIEPAFLARVVQPRWREGPSAALQVLAAMSFAADAEAPEG